MDDNSKENNIFNKDVDANKPDSRNISTADSNVKDIKSWDELLEESKIKTEDQVLSLEDLGIFKKGQTDTSMTANDPHDIKETSAEQTAKRSMRHNSEKKNSRLTDNLLKAVKTKKSLATTDVDSVEGNTNMHKSPNPGSKSNKTKNKKNMKKIRHLILIAILACFVAGAGIIGYIVFTTPDIDPSNIYSQLAQTSVIYDDNGEMIELIDSNENRTYVSYDQIPKNLINAVIAIEDKTFYEHKGFNFIRIVGAVVDSITKSKDISGTSTITQQLARNLYLTKERSYIRKLREAYYTVQLEKALQKEQIMEAYLNTIFLGFNSYGVQTASQSYFSKDVGDLTLEECATIAAIPKNPSKNAPLKRFENSEITSDNKNIVSRSDTYTIVYNEAFVDRQHQILDLMLEQEMISEQEYASAYSVWMKTLMKPSDSSLVDITSYFKDYMINEVKSDLQEALGIDAQTASNMLYNGGLGIYSTMNVSMQQVVEKEFENHSNFPSVTGLNKDSSGNIIDSKGNIILYNRSNYFDSNYNFALNSNEYSADSEDGSITLFGDKRLNFYKTESIEGTDYAIEFKNMYYIENGTFYVVNGGNIVIDSKYKKKTDSGDLVIDKDFFVDNPDFFKFNENGIFVEPAHYTLKQKVIQPQAAMVITDWDTGNIKAMVGGRDLNGRLLYNRTINTRQPGSSIKPIAVYAPALQTAVDSGSGWTASSRLEDAPNYVDGKLWPKNWYTGYKGMVPLRTCVEQSINITAVKLINDIGYDTSVKFLRGLGVTSIVTDDYNPAALGLGGMTKGISPIEMAAAYGAFPNDGLYIEPISYTKILDPDGNIIIDKTPKSNQAMDKGVAYIMTDILRTTVSEGIAKRASISGQPAAGKTGTTTDNYDAWFVGFTPQYSAALWIGNDINIELSRGSAAAASLWSDIMGRICNSLPYGSYQKPDNVEYRNGEYYVTGTYETRKFPQEDYTPPPPPPPPTPVEEQPDLNTGDEGVGTGNEPDDDPGEIPDENPGNGNGNGNGNENPGSDTPDLPDGVVISE